MGAYTKWSLYIHIYACVVSSLWIIPILLAYMYIKLFVVFSTTWIMYVFSEVSEKFIVQALPLGQYYYGACGTVNHWSVLLNTELVFADFFLWPSWGGLFHTLRPEPRRWQSPVTIFWCIFLKERFCILIQILLMFVPRDPFDNKFHWLHKWWNVSYVFKNAYSSIY